MRFATSGRAFGYTNFDHLRLHILVECAPNPTYNQRAANIAASIRSRRMAIRIVPPNFGREIPGTARRYSIHFRLKFVAMTERDFYRRRLPHWHPFNATFFVTFRLEGSLPKPVLNLLQEEYEQAKHLFDLLPPEQSHQKYYDACREAYARFDRALDKANGPRWLTEPQIAGIIRNEIHALHPHQYCLLAFCMMPNHVHLLVDMQDIPAPPPRKNGVSYTPLAYALWLLKGRSGHACQKILGKPGRFWSRESYDHVVRDEHEFERILSYIANNPVKAGLVKQWEDWPDTFVEQTYRDIV